MVEITNASNLMPTSITVVEDGSTIEVTTTPVAVSVNTGAVTIARTGITSVNGDEGPVVVLDTGDIDENGNLYYTDARSRSAISATGDINYDSNTGVISFTASDAPVTSVNTQTGAVVLTTSDIAEGTNEYYTDAKVQTVIDTNTAGFITSSALSPYYTSAQVDALPVSTFTNDAGYLTSETDSQTLSFVSPNLTISNGNTVDLSALTPTTIDWSTVTNTPTTISGYGITDAFDGDFSSLTNTPTTLAGYGITDGYTDADVDTHLNTATATTGEVLSWTGTDYDWITPAGANPFDQNLNTTDDVTFNTVTATDEFIGNLDGAIRFAGKNVSGVTILPGQVIYISGISGNTPEVDLARSDAAGTMPAFGIAIESIANTITGQFATFGTQPNLDIANWGETGVTFSQGDVLYVSATQAGRMTNVPPTGETNLIQNIGKVERAAPTTNTTIKVGGAGRTNATPNLNQGNIFLGNASNQSVSASLDTSVGAAGYIKNVVEDTTPQLGGALDVNDFDIVNSGVNPYFVLGNDNTLFSASRAQGAYRSSSLSGYDGSIRPWFHGDISKITLGADTSTGNARIINSLAQSLLDLNSFSLTSVGGLRGINNTVIAQTRIDNTGGTASSLAQNRNLNVQGIWMPGSNVTVDDTANIYIDQFYESDDSTGAITNAYGLYIRDGGTSGVTISNKHSIYSDGASNPMYHAGPITIGAYTLPNTDGTAGQVLTTDGLGNITFTTVSGGGSTFTGDLAGNTLTDSTGALTTIVNKSANPQSKATGLAATTQMSANVTIGQSDNISGTTQTWEIGSDIPAGTEFTNFDTQEMVFDTHGHSYIGDGLVGARFKLRHGNSDFATNGSGNIGNILGVYVDIGDNANGTNDNTIQDVTGMRVRVRDDFDRSSLNRAVGLDINLDGGLSDAGTFRSLLSENTDARMEHWGEARFGSGGDVRLAPGNDGAIRVNNKTGQTGPLVDKRVNNNPNFNPLDKTSIDQNISDDTYLFNQVERGYFSSHNTRATVTQQMQAPTAGSTSTPQVGYALTLDRPVYNPNNSVTSTISDTLFSFNKFGSSGFNLFNGPLYVPSRQNISFGFPIQSQQGFDNPYVGSNGGISVNNNLLTETGMMPPRIIFSYDTNNVSTFSGISDAAWNDTEFGAVSSVSDKIWGFGCAFVIEMESSIPSWGANATVTLTEALPPAGVIAGFPGDTGGITPLYANVPTWMNTSTRTLTMTRPATGKTFYRWKIEYSDGTLFVKDWEEFNLS